MLSLIWNENTEDFVNEEELDVLIKHARKSVYRLERIKAWSLCLDHPTDEQVQKWVEEYNEHRPPKLDIS